MGEFTSLLNTLIAENMKKKAIKNIYRSNEAKKNLVRYRPGDIEGFFERDLETGRYIISGGVPAMRSRAMISVAMCALSRNIPVVILHEGDEDLERGLQGSVQYTGNTFILNRRSQSYDPFFNRTNAEINNLILNSLTSDHAIGNSGGQYLEGITEFIRSKNIPPYCYMFLSCPYDVLFDKIDEALQNSRMTGLKAQQIRSLLMQGQNERANIQFLFSQLAYQGAGVFSTKGTYYKAVDIKEAVKRNGLFMMDIGSSTNEALLNILINEIREIIANGYKIVLLIDGININANELLMKTIFAQSARCLTTLASSDVYSMLGANESLFSSLAAGADKCVVMQHTAGISCTKWAEFFGSYESNKVSESIGNSGNYQWGYGSGRSSSFSINQDREYRVRPEEIARLNIFESYIADKKLNELAYCPLK